QTLAQVIASEIRSRGYRPEAVASIETSGAKYGVALSMATGLPYFSIHKSRKLVFQDTVEEAGTSVTESRDVRLYLDRQVASRFKSVVLVDDIRRSSKTLEAASNLLAACGVDIEACFVILDLAFAGHSPPSTIPRDRYHPLLVISSVDRMGRCTISEGVVLKHLEGHV
ncbi:MAG: phosphoribosyltransferase, partial [Nitrososphaerota archaeon]